MQQKRFMCRHNREAIWCLRLELHIRLHIHHQLSYHATACDLAPDSASRDRGHKNEYNHVTETAKHI